MLPHRPVVGNLFLISEVFRDCDAHLQSPKDVFEGLRHTAVCTFSTVSSSFSEVRQVLIFLLSNTHDRVIRENETCAPPSHCQSCNSRKNNWNKLVGPDRRIQHYQMDAPTFPSASCCHLITFPLGWPRHRSIYDLSR